MDHSPFWQIFSRTRARLSGKKSLALTSLAVQRSYQIHILRFVFFCMTVLQRSSIYFTLVRFTLAHASDTGPRASALGGEVISNAVTRHQSTPPSHRQAKKSQPHSAGLRTAVRISCLADTFALGFATASNELDEYQNASLGQLAREWLSCQCQ